MMKVSHWHFLYNNTYVVPLVQFTQVQLFEQL